MPPTRYLFNPTNTEVAQLSTTWRRAVGAAPDIHLDGERPKTALWLWVREITWYLYEECADEWRQNNADIKLLRENCVMNGFIIFGIMFFTATGLENSPQSFGVYAVSQSRSVVTAAENRPQITRLSQMENSAMGTCQFTRTIIPNWFEKWRDIKFWYMSYLCRSLELRCVSLLMMHKTCSINYGHLADLQETLPTTDLSK